MPDTVILEGTTYLPTTSSSAIVISDDAFAIITAIKGLTDQARRTS